MIYKCEASFILKFKEVLHNVGSPCSSQVFPHPFQKPLFLKNTTVVKGPKDSPKDNNDAEGYEQGFFQREELNTGPFPFSPQACTVLLR